MSEKTLSLADGPEVKVAHNIEIKCGIEGMGISIEVINELGLLFSTRVWSGTSQHIDVLRAMCDVRLFEREIGFVYKYVGDVERLCNLDLYWVATGCGLYFLKNNPEIFPYVVNVYKSPGEAKKAEARMSDKTLSLSDSPEIEFDGKVKIKCLASPVRIKITVEDESYWLFDANIYANDPQYKDVLQAFRDARLFVKGHGSLYRYVGDVERWCNLDIHWHVTEAGKEVLKHNPERFPYVVNGYEDKMEAVRASKRAAAITRQGDKNE